MKINQDQAERLICSVVEALNYSKKGRFIPYNRNQIADAAMNLRHTPFVAILTESHEPAIELF